MSKELEIRALTNIVLIKTLPYPYKDRGQNLEDFIEKFDNVRNAFDSQLNLHGEHLSRNLFTKEQIKIMIDVSKVGMYRQKAETIKTNKYIPHSFLLDNTFVDLIYNLLLIEIKDKYELINKSALETYKFSDESLHYLSELIKMIDVELKARNREVAELILEEAKPALITQLLSINAIKKEKEPVLAFNSLPKILQTINLILERKNIQIKNNKYGLANLIKLFNKNLPLETENKIRNLTNNLTAENLNKVATFYIKLLKENGYLTINLVVDLDEYDILRFKRIGVILENNKTLNSTNSSDYYHIANIDGKLLKLSPMYIADAKTNKVLYSRKDQKIVLKDIATNLTAELINSESLTINQIKILYNLYTTACDLRKKKIN